jgi:hypothetical protein
MSINYLKHKKATVFGLLLFYVLDNGFWFKVGL